MSDLFAALRPRLSGCALGCGSRPNVTVVCAGPGRYVQAAVCEPCSRRLKKIPEFRSATGLT